jgi:hypothetical protein
MPKGLKETSSLITIGFETAQTVLNTFEQGRTDLQLNPLDNEVFVVLGINLDGTPPDALPGTDSVVTFSVTTTNQTALLSAASSAVLAFGQNRIMAAGFVDSGVGFMQGAGETPATNLDYIGIIATNDFFVAINSQNCANLKSVSGKMYGYRARADSSVYAALVQSEVLSA